MTAFNLKLTAMARALALFNMNLKLLPRRLPVPGAPPHSQGRDRSSG